MTKVTTDIIKDCHVVTRELVTLIDTKQRQLHIILVLLFCYLLSPFPYFSTFPCLYLYAQFSINYICIGTVSGSFLSELIGHTFM